MKNSNRRPGRALIATLAGTAAVAGLAVAFALNHPGPQNDEGVAITTVQQGQPSSQPTRAAPAWEIDGVHSGISFATMRGASEFHGRFNSMEGTIHFAPDALAGSKFEITVPISSLDTNSAGRDRHLASADFFNAVQYPAISFTSTGLKEVEHKAAADAPEAAADDKHYLMTGELTMHGQTREIEAHLVFLGTAELRGKTNAGLRATFAIDRTQFGLTAWEGMIGKDVELTVWINATR